MSGRQLPRRRRLLHASRAYITALHRRYRRRHAEGLLVSSVERRAVPKSAISARMTGWRMLIFALNINSTVPEQAVVNEQRDVDARRRRPKKRCRLHQHAHARMP